VVVPGRGPGRHRAAGRSFGGGAAGSSPEYGWRGRGVGGRGGATGAGSPAGTTRTCWCEFHGSVLGGRG